MKSSLDLIRAACVKANAEIKSRNYYTETPGMDTIRLADVLLAIRQTWKNSQPVEEQYTAAGKQYELLDLWNLRLDNLESQSPETIEFIVSLLK